MPGVGTALALVAAVSWACANIAIKESGRRIGSWPAVVWAQVIGCVVAVPIALLVDGLPPLPSASVWGLLVGAGVASCVAYAGLFQALRLGQVTIVSPILSGWSLASVTIAAVFFDMPLSVLGACGVVLAVAGNAVLARIGAKDGKTPRSAIAWALAGAVGFAAMMPLVEQAGVHVGRLWTVPAVWMVDLLVGVPLLWRLGHLQRRPRSASDWRVAASTGVLEVFGFVAVSMAFSYATVAVVTPIASLNTAGTVALGLWLLKERVPRKALVGAVAASIGVVLLHL